MQAVIIVIGLLLVFMGLQSGLIIGGILVLIITGTLLLMYLFNITLQRVSLGALIIAMGMLVDNSIVVTEGILVRYQKGEDRLKAAAQVVKQTMWPLFGATLVAIFAFAAVGIVAEFSRRIYKNSLLRNYYLAHVKLDTCNNIKPSCLLSFYAS